MTCPILLLSLPFSQQIFECLLQARYWGPMCCIRQKLELCITLGRGAAKKSKPSKVSFRFQNRCMWAGEPFLPICSWRCLKMLHKSQFLSSLTCTAAQLHLTILPPPSLTLSPFVLLLTPLSISHTLLLACSSSWLLSYQANLMAPELGSVNWDYFQRPILKLEISE